MTDKQIPVESVKDLKDCYSIVSGLLEGIQDCSYRLTCLETSVQFLLKKNAEVGTYTFEEDAEAGGGEDGSVEDEVIV